MRQPLRAVAGLAAAILIFGACSSGATEPSHVLLAIGQSRDLAHGSLRLSVGRGNTVSQVDEVVAAVSTAVERLRLLAPLHE